MLSVISKLSMIIFLYGPDSYRLRQETNSVIAKYKEKYPGGLNFFSINLEDGNPNKLKDIVRTESFFNDVKLILIKNAFNKSITEEIGDLIESYDLLKTKSVVLLFNENALGKELAAKSKKLFGTLSDSKNLVRNFEVLEGRKLESWIEKEFSLRNCSVSSPVIKLLIQLAGVDSARLIIEIEKLSNFKLRGDIKPEDIKLLIHNEAETNIFNLLDALSSKNREKAFELLYKELKTGRDPHYLLTMFVYQLRNSLVVKDLLSRKLSTSEIAKRAKLHPFVVSKLAKILNQQSDDLKSKFSVLAQVEVLAKKGIIDVEESLYNFVLNC